MVGIDREKIRRLDLTNHFFHSLCGRVTTDVDFHHVVVNDIVTFAVEVVFQSLNRAFVSRNDRRREHNRVVLLQFDETVVVGDDARKCSIELALRAGTDDHDFVVCILVNIVHRNKRIGLRFDIAEFFGYFNVHLHTVSFESNFLSELFRVFDQVTNTTHLRRKGSDDEAPWSILDQVLKIAVHVLF